jgi:SynChlorMet cassette protein ScmC
VLGDDLALVVRDATGNFVAHPLPTWSAVKSGEIRWSCRVNQAVSLRALFILEQAAQDRVEPLAGAKSTVMIAAAGGEALAPLNYLPIRQVSPVRKCIFDRAANLAAAIPAYRLHISLGGCFWEKIEEVVEEAGCEVPGARILREERWKNAAAVASGISGNGRIA